MKTQSIMTLEVTPYGPDQALIGPTAPICEDIDSLIKLLATVRLRYGNVPVKHKIQWGASALWAGDRQKLEIEKLRKSNKSLRRKVRDARALLEAWADDAANLKEHAQNTLEPT